METAVQTQHLRSLASLSVGQTLRVVHVQRGCGAQGRLLSLGLRKGAKVRIVRASVMSGPLIVKVGESELAIGQCLAQAILGEMTTP